MLNKNDLKNMALEDLNHELKSALVSLVNLRMLIYDGKEKSSHKVTAFKKYIAQINMLISAKD